MNKLVKNTFAGATTPGFHSSIPAALLCIAIGILGFYLPIENFPVEGRTLGHKLDATETLVAIGCIVVGVVYIFFKIKGKKKAALSTDVQQRYNALSPADKQRVGEAAKFINSELDKGKTYEEAQAELDKAVKRGDI